MAKLTLDDITDLRAYERERDGFRREVIALKKRRRVALGPVLTVVFENRDTIRFQIQEMARAERIMTDEGIQIELDVYNPLVPEAGALGATLFLELRTDDELRTWLPKLVGIETRLAIRLGTGGPLVRCEVDPDHERQLTREDVTASVHYVHFRLSPSEVEAFAAGPVSLVVDHPAYEYEAELRPETVSELLADLRGA